MCYPSSTQEVHTSQASINMSPSSSGPKEQDEGYVLTRDAVEVHRLSHDAWIIHNGFVYDITMFLSSHPGGAKVMMPYLGTDVTKVMEGESSGDSKNIVHKHSAYAMRLLEKFKIGTLAGGQGNVDPRTGKPLVDWSKPILHQVGMLGTKYEHWIHSFPTTDGTVKMFTNDTLENLTKCPWYVPLLFWLPVLCIEMSRYLGKVGGVWNINPFTFATMALFGGISWLLFEYTLHRFVFHIHTESYAANIFHFLLHGHHHITPMDFDRLVFPPVPAMLVGWPFWLFGPMILGDDRGYPWLAGFLIGYLVYDMTHYWIHRTMPPLEFLKRQKSRHVHHHYHQPNVNFGISNPLFDHVFRTLKEPHS
eukprot:Plantae.Rhodophyta-Hildenbrandia_rubra.ctg14982.p1 GENE.Plantae.Rhodophyta-Hildenbrandia_rubra.ctg14982~~Plantae.Rhodophyta-Hildenbrandia_rubra.ctg14982.p1  ORF type:complete len:363 (-),score=41.17 Plantae.Rhodophyta-Hildenbrandia_rubra.ctg14982:204-1292(-)